MAAPNRIARAARRFVAGVVWVFYGGPRAAIRWLIGRGSNLLAVLWLCGLAVFVVTAGARARGVWLAERAERRREGPKPVDAGTVRVQLVVADLEDSEVVMERRLEDVEGMQGLIDSMRTDDGGLSAAGLGDGGTLATLRALKALSKVRGTATPAEVAQMQAFLENESGTPRPAGAPPTFDTFRQEDVEVVFAGDGGLVGLLERNKHKARRRIDDPQTLALLAEQLSGEDLVHSVAAVLDAGASAVAAVVTPLAAPTAASPSPPPSAPTEVERAPTPVAPLAEPKLDAGDTGAATVSVVERPLDLRALGGAMLHALQNTDLVRDLDAGALDAGLVEATSDAGTPAEADAGRGDAGAAAAGATDAGRADAGALDAGLSPPDAGVAAPNRRKVKR